jgi:glycosyltransferase involved in cell wall biosynthesis
MRLLFVADGRSPIALNWIRHFVNSGYEVHLATTFPCEPALTFASVTFIPLAFSGAKSRDNREESHLRVINVFAGASFVGLRTTIRQWFGPFTLHSARNSLQVIIDRVQPDLIHAMRIPYEGMLVALTLNKVRKAQSRQNQPPFLVSVWGNDFTLHGTSTPLMSRYTKATLRIADALHTDCLRDQRLAYKWGFPQENPAIVLPGGGGVDLDVFSPLDHSSKLGGELKTVINPRGVRAYIRNDTFFQSAALVLEKCPQVRFICIGMEDDPQIRAMVNDLGIASSVELLPQVLYSKMSELFKTAQVAVSPSTHDGTPNTLLEAMASGCFPIAGDIESLREWIIPGENGLLVDPIDPLALSRAILTALNDDDLRSKAARYNIQLIADKASYQVVMKSAERFYKSLVSCGNN